MCMTIYTYVSMILSQREVAAQIAGLVLVVGKTVLESKNAFIRAMRQRGLPTDHGPLVHKSNDFAILK